MGDVYRIKHDFDAKQSICYNIKRRKAAYAGDIMYETTVIGYWFLLEKRRLAPIISPEEKVEIVNIFPFLSIF